MNETLLRLLLITALIVVAAGLAWLARRKLSHHPPVDIGGIEFDPGLVVFTSTACGRCREVMTAAKATGAPMREVTFELEPDLQQQVGVVGVPLTLVIDHAGNVSRQFAGLVNRWQLRRALRSAQS